MNKLENKNTISEIMNQVKQIEENMLINKEYTNSMNMLINSNDLARSKDQDLTDQVNQLDNHIDDINKLTSNLLNDLASRYN